MSPSMDDVNYTRTILNILCKQRLGLKICHLNAQSVLPKIDELRSIFIGSSIDIIMISETWLKPKTFDSMVDLNGYNTFRWDRTTDRTSGGVKNITNASFLFHQGVKFPRLNTCFMK